MFWHLHVCALLIAGKGILLSQHLPLSLRRMGDAWIAAGTQTGSGAVGGNCARLWTTRAAMRVAAARIAFIVGC